MGKDMFVEYLERQESQMEQQAIQRGLENFKRRLHLYSLTSDGEARAQFLRDREYDQQKAAWHKAHPTGIDETNIVASLLDNEE